MNVYAPSFAVAVRPSSASSKAGDRPGGGPNYRHISASIAAHALVIVALFFLPTWPPDPVEVVVPFVTLADNGSSGSAGGSPGSGGSETPSEADTAEALTPSPELVPEPIDAAKPDPVATAIPIPRPPRARPPTIQPRPVQQAPTRPTATPSPPSPVTSPAPPTPTPTPQPPGTSITGTADPGPGGAAGAGAGVSGAGTGAVGTGQGPGDDYLERLRRHLARHREYPAEAKRLKQEGTAFVEFTLARDGTVTAAALARSSGFPLLDQAVLDMLRRGSPVPPLPDQFAGDRLTLTMPIRFSLGFFSRVF